MPFPSFLLSTDESASSSGATKSMADQLLVKQLSADAQTGVTEGRLQPETMADRLAAKHINAAPPGHSFSPLRQNSSPLCPNHHSSHLKPTLNSSQPDRQSSLQLLAANAAPTSHSNPLPPTIEAKRSKGLGGSSMLKSALTLANLAKLNCGDSPISSTQSNVQRSHSSGSSNSSSDNNVAPKPVALTLENVSRHNSLDILPPSSSAPHSAVDISSSALFKKGSVTAVEKPVLPTLKLKQCSSVPDALDVPPPLSDRSVKAAAANPLQAFCATQEPDSGSKDLFNLPEITTNREGSENRTAAAAHEAPRPPTQPKPPDAFSAPSSQWSSKPKLLVMSSNLPQGMSRPTWCLKDYIIQDKIYSGYASEVYKTKCRHSNVTVVLKVYSMMKLGELQRFYVFREVRLHSSVCQMSQLCDHVIKLYGAFQQGSYVILVQEYASGGDLFELQRTCGGRLAEGVAVKQVLLPFLTALKALHASGIAHRDIKPENIFFTGNKCLKMGDFGLSINMRDERPVTRVGTTEYMAPEVLDCPDKDDPEENKDNSELEYTHQVDTWAVGVLAYELVVGLPPFSGKRDAITENKIRSEAPKFPSRMSEQCRDFISMALEKDPIDRPTIVELLRHPWIQWQKRSKVPQASSKACSRKHSMDIQEDRKDELRGADLGKASHSDSFAIDAIDPALQAHAYFTAMTKAGHTHAAHPPEGNPQKASPLSARLKVAQEDCTLSCPNIAGTPTTKIATKVSCLPSGNASAYQNTGSTVQHSAAHSAASEQKASSSYVGDL